MEFRAGVTQLVECDLAKVDVAGSNPVSRSKNHETNPSGLIFPDKASHERTAVRPDSF